MLHISVGFMIWLVSTILVKQNGAQLEAYSNELDKLRDSLVLCVLNISDQNFPRTGNVAFIIPSVNIVNQVNTAKSVTVLIEGELLRVLFKHTAWSIFTRNSSKPSEFFSIVEVTHNYIIHVRNPIDILEVLRFLKLSSWNPHAKFVIFTTTLFDKPDEMAADVITALWSFHILNAIIVIPRISDETISDVYTWYPFAMGNCGNNFNKTVIMNTCQRGKFVNNTTLFPNKIPMDLNGCPVVTRTIVWPPYVIPPEDLDQSENMSNIKFTKGIEVQLFNTIAEAANFTPIYKISTAIQDWGEILSNGSASEGLFKELITEKVDVAMAALAATRSRYMFLDYTTTYTKESVTWCVPTAAEESKWLSLKRILQNNTWLATILTLCFVIVLMWRTSLLNAKESSVYKKIGSCSIYIFCVTLSMPIKNCPKQIHSRIIFAMWVVFSFLLTVAFQTLLMSKLTQPDFEPQLDTIEEIFERDMPFGYLPGIRIYFYDKENWISTKLLQDGEDCADAEECLKRIAIDRDFALALPRQYLLSVAQRFIGKDGQSLVYWFKTDTVSYPIQLYAYKGYPLTSRLDELIVRIKSGGFIDKWSADSMLSSQKLNHQLIIEDDELSSSREKVLTVDHLKSAFAILAFGYVLGILAFLTEISHYKYRQSKTKDIM